MTTNPTAKKGAVAKWKQQVRELKQDVYALFLACRDPRVPWYAKAIAGLVVGYAFSPIDLIPDFVPILGYLDDLVLVPLGIVLVLKLVPAPVMEEFREQARVAMESESKKPVNWIAALVIVSIWLACIGGIGILLWRYGLRRRF